MIRSLTHRYLARATLEFSTPLHVGSGSPGLLTDALVVADANGLPAIPGSSLAGVLRSEYRKRHGGEEKIFGSPGGKDGYGSRLSVSWGCVHDSAGRPVEGLCDPTRLEDPVLRNALASVYGEANIRDQVCIGMRGTAEDSKKFVVSYVCAGHRFTFEIELAGDESDGDNWERLLGILQDPALRLGGKTRRGFGSFGVISLKTAVFDLNKDFPAYSAFPAGLEENAPGLQESRFVPGTPGAASVTAQLELVPEGYWMFGGGEDMTESEHPADMASVRDALVRWPSGGGAAEVRENVLIIPATAVKGALSHRTAFHYNIIRENFADRIEEEQLEACCGENNEAVRQLFGCIGESGEGMDSNNRRKGMKGRVIIDDLLLEEVKPPSQLLPHVSLDRFTGGAKTLTGALFSERPFWQGPPLKLSLTVTGPEEVEPDVRRALNRALEDLAEGRLQLGAGSGRGLGYFRARGGVQWSDEGQWIRGGE